MKKKTKRVMKHITFDSHEEARSAMRFFERNREKLEKQGVFSKKQPYGFSTAGRSLFNAANEGKIKVEDLKGRKS